MSHVLASIRCTRGASTHRGALYDAKAAS
jgi:hypothetical protein